MLLFVLFVGILDIHLAIESEGRFCSMGICEKDEVSGQCLDALSGPTDQTRLTYPLFR